MRADCARRSLHWWQIPLVYWDHVWIIHYNLGAHSWSKTAYSGFNRVLLFSFSLLESSKLKANQEQNTISVLRSDGMQASKRFLKCFSFVRRKNMHEKRNNKTTMNKHQEKMHILLGQSLRSNENKYNEWYKQTHKKKSPSFTFRINKKKLRSQTRLT